MLAQFVTGEILIGVLHWEIWDDTTYISYNGLDKLLAWH